MTLYSPGGLNLADTTAPLILAYDDSGTKDVVFAVSATGDLTITPDGGDVTIAGALAIATNMTLAEADAAQMAVRMVRAGGTVTDWILYCPAASTDFRLHQGGDRFTFGATGNFIAHGPGPHAIGGAILDYVQFRLVGAFSSGGASSFATAAWFQTDLTSDDGDTTWVANAIFGGTIATQAVDEIIDVVASVVINEPGITNNLLGGKKPAIAASLYIPSAPTEGTVNDALHVAAGTSYLSGNVGIGVAAGTAALEITEADATPGLIVTNSHASTPDGVLIDFSVDSPNDTTQYFLQCEDSTEVRATIWSDGSITGDGGLLMGGCIASGSVTVTASADDTDVSGVNTVLINPGAAVVIGAFVGGVAGQILNVVVIDPDQDVTLEHNEGTGNQNIFMHKGADETLGSEYGGWVLVCDGTSWFDTSHSVH